MLDDDTTCYRHDDRSAAVACQRCERPICTDCMHSASVGFHCPSCTKAGAQKVVRARDIGAGSRTPVTLALIIINVFVYLLQGSGLTIGDPAQTVTGFGQLVPAAVADGEWWRVLTSAFLHRSPLHLASNMFALWIFGQLLERGIGTRRYLLIYGCGLFGGSLAVILLSYDTAVAGASGAAMGLAGATAAVMWARNIPLTQTSAFVIIVANLAIPLVNPGISFSGHLGGAIGGFVAGWLLAWLPEKFGQPRSLALAATVAWGVTLAALSVVGPSTIGA